MSAMDFINYMMIEDTRASTVNQQTLTDLQSKADYIEKKTGQTPMSWYEFQKETPVEKPSFFKNLALGAATGGIAGIVIGAVIAGVLGGLAPIAMMAVAGAAFGGAVGAFSETNVTMRSDQIEKYGNYLNNLEQQISRAPTIQQEVSQEPVKGKHTERVLAERQQAVSQEMVAGR